MRIASVFLALLFSATTALADSNAPEYSEDPFGDFALSDESLILNIDFHPAGHGEVAAVEALVEGGAPLDQAPSPSPGIPYVA